MELSEGIYEDLHRHPNDGEYANLGAQRPREVKGHHGKCGFSVILSEVVYLPLWYLTLTLTDTFIQGYMRNLTEPFSLWMLLNLNPICFLLSVEKVGSGGHGAAVSSAAGGHH